MPDKSNSNQKRSDVNFKTPNIHKKDFSNEGNYFSSLADKYSKAAHILYIALAVCFVLTLLFNSKLFTYDNFNYLMKDIDTAFDVAAKNYNSISYTNDELRVTGSFRGGIITASTTDMAVYTATGKKTLHINESFVSPEIATSKKYAIVYDLGGNNYSIYNSFARVYHSKMDYSISSVSVADNGWYAITSKDSEHISVVYLYNEDFKLKNTFYFATKYVFATSINEKGNRIAIITLEADPNGDKFSTGIMLCEPGKSEPISEMRISGGIPYGVSFTENETLQVVCTDGLYIINENNGKIEDSVSIDFQKPKRISLSSEGCAIAFGQNSATVKNTILVFDSKGKKICETEIENGILDLELQGNYVFVNQSGSITRINTKNGNTTTVETYDKGTNIIVYNSNNILLCCQTKAKYINI